MMNKIDLKKLAQKIRIHSLNMCHNAKSSHIGSCLSCAEILAVLYGKILSSEDKFIMSKGHATAALYATLAEVGIINPEILNSYYTNNSKLFGHTTIGISGVEVSTGSLGHGLSIGCGMAIAGKKVFVLMGDGECNEGSVWEAILFAGHHKLENLVAIIDYNGIQSFGNTDKVIKLEPFMDKLESFQWGARFIEGNSIETILWGLNTIPYNKNKPSCIIAHTVKGKGVSYMENKLKWHYNYPNEEELKIALEELEDEKRVD